MKATIADLRSRTHDVLAALDRNEEVTIYHRGKLRGILSPPPAPAAAMRVEDHPLFGSQANDPETVESVMNRLRGPRHPGTSAPFPVST